MIEFDDSVADDANVSNLDNKTGYKFGNTYKDVYKRQLPIPYRWKRRQLTRTAR